MFNIKITANLFENKFNLDYDKKNEFSLKISRFIFQHIILIAQIIILPRKSLVCATAELDWTFSELLDIAALLDAAIITNSIKQVKHSQWTKLMIRNLIFDNSTEMT